MLTIPGQDKLQQMIKQGSISTQDTPRSSNLSTEGSMTESKPAPKRRYQPSKQHRDCLKIKISPFDGPSRVSKNLVKIEKFFMNKHATVEQDQDDYSGTRTRLRTTMVELGEIYQELDLHFVSFFATSMVSRVLSAQTNKLELSFGDIEFVFWTCFYICLKFTQEFHFISINDFSKLVRIKLSLLRSTEKYFLVDVLEFKIADIVLR